MANFPRDVSATISKLIGKEIRNEMEKEALKKFQEIKDEMIQEFLNHPVTQEIKAGPSASNSSGTLGGVSNLFAFIGFEELDDPIKPIIDLLNSTKMTYGGLSPMGIKFIIFLPEARDIFSATPLPWATGRSWAEGIEKGISGLGFLLRNSSNSSRSGAAIQSSVKIRSGKYKNTQYISYIINKYDKKFKKLND
jgi:hypothetical protein